MAHVKAIYGLEPILDNPKFEGFGMGKQPSLMGLRDRYEDLCMQFDTRAVEWKVAAAYRSVETASRHRASSAV